MEEKLKCDFTEQDKKVYNDYAPGKIIDLQGKEIEDGWFSFNKNWHDYHLLPKDYQQLDVTPKDIYDQIEIEMSRILSFGSDIKFNSKDGKIMGQRVFLGSGRGRNTRYGHTGLHIYNYCHPAEDEYEYLILFSRLWLDGDKINNNFLQAQFVRNKWKEKGKELSTNKANINWQADEFDMMYPLSGEDGSFCYNTKSGHCVYNPYDLTIKSDSEKIAKQFLAFISGEIIDFSEDSLERVCKDVNNYIDKRYRDHIYGTIQKKEQTQ